MHYVAAFRTEINALVEFAGTTDVDALHAAYLETEAIWSRHGSYGCMIEIKRAAQIELMDRALDAIERSYA